MSESKKPNECDRTKTSSSKTCAQPSEIYVQYLRSLSQQWSSYGAAQLVTGEVLQYLVPRFDRCSTPLKIRILVSFMHLKPAVRKENAKLLSYFLMECESDSDDWVRKLSRLLQPFISTGYAGLKEVDTETIYRVIKYLDEEAASNAPPTRRSHDEVSARQLSSGKENFPQRTTNDASFNINSLLDPDITALSAYRRKPGLEEIHMCHPVKFTHHLPDKQLPLQYEHDTRDFRPHADFHSFMKDVECAGLAQMDLLLSEGDRRKQQQQQHQNDEHLRMHQDQQQSELSVAHRPGQITMIPSDQSRRRELRPDQ